jgi:hypothetical protein
MSKKRHRRLWIGIRANIKHKPKPETVLARLKQSITDGTYELPKSYKVVVRWRNANTDWKEGEWHTVMTESAASSTGFDSAMLGWLYQKGAR